MVRWNLPRYSDGQDCAPGINHHHHLSALLFLVSVSPGEQGAGGGAVKAALPESGSEAPGSASFCSELEPVPFRAPWPGLLPLILKCQKPIRPETRHYNSTRQTLRTPSPCNCQKSITEGKSDPLSKEWLFSVSFGTFNRGAAQGFFLICLIVYIMSFIISFLSPERCPGTPRCHHLAVGPGALFPFPSL